MADEMNNHTSCISQHPGFQTVCLNVCVLQTAYYQHRQHYRIGPHSSPLHECVSNLLIHGFCLLFLSYLWLRKVWIHSLSTAHKMVFGIAGKGHQRDSMNLCILTIREIFPSVDYTGFKYPTL